MKILRVLIKEQFSVKVTCKNKNKLTTWRITGDFFVDGRKSMDWKGSWLEFKLSFIYDVPEVPVGFVLEKKFVRSSFLYRSFYLYLEKNLPTKYKFKRIWKQKVLNHPAILISKFKIWFYVRYIFENTES